MLDYKIDSTLVSKDHRHKAIELFLNQNMIAKIMPSVPASRQGECIEQTSTRRGGLELTQYDTADTRSGYYSSYMVLSVTDELLGKRQ